MEKIKKQKSDTKTRAAEIVKITCEKCKKGFGVDKNYIGVITCPYCGKYVEG